MKYLTSLQTAQMLGVSKRYINQLCSSHQIAGAYNNGYRWMIPEDFVYKKLGTEMRTTSCNRTFNTTGDCDT